MSMGHLYAARARAEMWASEPGVPDHARLAFEGIAEILSRYIAEELTGFREAAAQRPVPEDNVLKPGTRLHTAIEQRRQAQR